MSGLAGDVLLCVRECVHAYVRVRACVRACICACACMRACMHMCVCVHACVHAYVCVQCKCVHGEDVMCMLPTVFQENVVGNLIWHFGSSLGAPPN